MRPKRVKIPGPYTVYLLHFTHPVEPLHYVGITTPRRLDARMREHASGRGSLPTAYACTLGLSWSLAATWETEHRSLEKKIGGLRPLNAVCPVCRGVPPFRNYEPTKMASSREAGHHYSGLNLATEFRKAAPKKTNEKGAKPKSDPSSLFFGRT